MFNIDNKADLFVASSGADSMQGPVRLRKTVNHGWLVVQGESALTLSKKPQSEEL